ncbi:MAG: tetratricopeptide repeat protein [Elusimicrobiaceae bacterium]|nr:tetratricopeptide repeat protein [Elusimicrobiaceae bacterium]
MNKFLRILLTAACVAVACQRRALCAAADEPELMHAAKGAEIAVSAPAPVAPDAYALYVDGVLKESEGKYGDALALYEQALALDPKATEVYRDAIKAAMRTGKMDVAQRCMTELLKLQPDNAGNLALSGMVNWGQGRIPEAVADYEKALSLEPDNSDALYQLSLLVRDSEPKRSLEYLVKYSELNDQDRPRVYYEIAVLKLRQNDTAGAEEYFKKAAALSPDFLQPRYALGQLYEVRNATAAAIAVYKEVLKADPKNDKLNVRVGELYLALDKVPEAEACFRRGVEIDSANPTANYWLAAIAEERKDYAAAAEFLHNSSEYEKTPSLALRRSLYLTQNHQVREAVNVLNDAYGKWPEVSDIGYFYALGLTDQKQYEKAFEVLAGICKREPDNLDALVQLGVTAERLNRMDVMEQSFDAVLSTRPQNPMVLNYYGYALADRGLKLGQAQEYVEKALALEPDNGAYQDSLGWIQFKRGQYPQALASILKAARNSPYDAEIWAHMGAVYSVLGSSGPAWLSYRTAYVLEPALPDLQRKAQDELDRIPKPERGGLYLKYLAQTQGGYEKYSALCNVTLETGGSGAQFKGIVDYEPGTGVTFSLTGPMFTPVWKAEISSAGAFRHDMAETMGVESEKLDAIARGMMRILSDYYGGAMFRAAAGRGAEFSSGWGGVSVETGDYVLGFSKQGDTLDSVKFSDGGEISLLLGDYGRFGLHMVPKYLEFRRFGFKVRVSVVKDNPSFSDNGGIIPK